MEEILQNKNDQSVGQKVRAQLLLRLVQAKLLFEYFWNSFYLNNIYELNTEIKNGEKLRLTDIDKFYFQYFTLEQLNDETTVNLSFIESFYIDFGKVFSILAITIYGFLLGNIYYFFSNKLNIIFFVFFLFLLFPIYLQIEVGMQQVTNYTIKFLNPKMIIQSL